jgi:hypothetical protein
VVHAGPAGRNALALTAFKGDVKNRNQTSEPAWLKHGYRFLLGCVRPDGGIHQTNLVTYNTSISMMALLAANQPEYDPVIRKARQFLISLQRDFGEQGKLDDVFDGASAMAASMNIQTWATPWRRSKRSITASGWSRTKTSSTRAT